jgi:hypothetical protein
MSLQIPIRLKIEENGVVKGYVETLDFSGAVAVTVNRAIGHVNVTGGGGGGDADTLQGHPASFFATETDLTTAEGNISVLNVEVAALMDRAQMWAMLGVAVQQTAPPAGITYANWLGGVPGNWGWIRIP